MGSAYHTTSPIYKLNASIKLINAKGGGGKKYFEKDQIITADCYAYEAGKIKYVENKRGGLEVWIGDTKYAYSPESLYYYPEGTEIKKYQRFCSGIVNMRQVTFDLPNDINSAFNIFRNQYYSLTSSRFQKEGIVDPADMQEEIIELVFAGLTEQIINPQTEKLEQIEYQGTQNAILGRKSFFTTLSYGWSAKAINRALKGELNLEGDTMTETVLGLLLNDRLDK